MTSLKPLLGLLLVGAAACSSTQSSEARRVEVVREAHQPELLVRKARAYSRIGDATRAQQYYETALEAGADEELVLPELIQVCVLDRRYRTAASYMESYLTQRPSNYRLRFLLATVYIGLERSTDAAQELKRVLRTQPRHADAHFMLAILLRDHQGDFAAADEHFRMYLRLQPRGKHADRAEQALLKRVP